MGPGYLQLTIFRTFHSPKCQDSQGKKHEGEEATELHGEGRGDADRQTSQFIPSLVGVASPAFPWPLPASKAQTGSQRPGRLIPERQWLIPVPGKTARPPK